MEPAPPWPRSRFRLIVPNAIDAVPVGQAFVRSCAIPMGFGSDDLAAIETAVEETVLNVLQHAYGRDELQSVTVDCVRHPDQLEVVVCDQGRPYDPEALPDFRGIDPEQLVAPPGLGRTLVLRLMDRVETRNLGALGKELRLFKRLARDWSPPAESPGFRDAGPALTADDFEDAEIRPMRPGEAVEVSRLIYDAYRYTYMMEAVYDPDGLRRLGAEGRLRSFVAVMRSGVVASHVALIRAPEMPDIAEIGLAVTLPEARGHRLVERAGLLVVDAAVRLGLSGLYTACVTAHAASQKAASRQGLGAPVGFFLGRSPQGVRFEGLAGPGTQRNSTLVLFKKLADRPRRPVWAPPAHRSIVRDLYAGCGVEADFPEEAPEALPELPTELETSVERGRNIATFRVPRAGRDVAARVKTRLFALRLENVPVAFALLDLLSPGTPAVAEALLPLGFFFSGILPGGVPGGDALLLTCFLSGALDYDRIVAVGDDAQRLLAYVRRQDPQLAGAAG